MVQQQKTQHRIRKNSVVVHVCFHVSGWAWVCTNAMHGGQAPEGVLQKALRPGCGVVWLQRSRGQGGPHRATARPAGPVRLLPPLIIISQHVVLLVFF